MVRIDRVIPGVLAAIIREAPLCPEKIAFAWREAVGPAIARVSTVRRDDSGVLHVSVEPSWAAEIHRSARLILGRLERLLGPGVVTSIEPSRQDSSPPRRRR